MQAKIEWGTCPSSTGETRADELAETVAMERLIQSIIDYLKYDRNLSNVLVKQDMFDTVNQINYAYQRRLAKELMIFIRQQKNTPSSSFCANPDERIELANEFLQKCNPNAIQIAESWLSTDYDLKADQKRSDEMEERITSVMKYIKTDEKISVASHKQAMIDLAKEITFPYQRLLARELIKFIEQARPVSLWSYAVSFFCEDPKERIKIAREFLEKCHPDAVLSARKWLLSEQQHISEIPASGSLAC